MLTEAQLAELAAAQGPVADRLYLTRMIEHHLGAIAMAKGAVSAGRNAYAVDRHADLRPCRHAEPETWRRPSGQKLIMCPARPWIASLTASLSVGWA